MGARKYDYDLFVIGAGSGGVRASRMAATFGAKVAVAEERDLGGTCVNVGCIPKKLLVYAAHFRDDFEDAAGFGWTVGERRIDWRTLIANKDREIERLNGVYRRLLQIAGVDIIEGRARLVDAHTVAVGSAQHSARVHPDRLRRMAGDAGHSRYRARDHLERSVPSRSPAGARADRRRRLHRRGVRDHLPRSRGRRHPAPPRPTLPARLRR